jgi:3-dehydroquinate synthase
LKKIADIVTSKGGSYPVLSGVDAETALKGLWRSDWKQGVVIADSNTGPLFSRTLSDSIKGMAGRVLELSFPAGEENKNRRTKEVLEDSMLKAGVDRTACIIAVGGGVTLDLAGFVAATYMRGIDHVNVATSLLAQVDASIGGKTGVDTPYGKNLIGTFHQPRAVFIDTGALKTLPLKELRNGMAELVKHAVIADPVLFTALERMPFPDDKTIPPEILNRSVLIKALVVQEDERENGKRRILNFGHTAGHAIEMAMDYKEPHGYCVSAGMVVEAMIAEKICGFPGESTKRLIRLLARFGLPVAPRIGFDALSQYLASDKKNRGGEIHCALPKSLGVMEEAGGRWSLPVDPSLFKETFDRLGGG